MHVAKSLGITFVDLHIKLSLINHISYVKVSKSSKTATLYNMLIAWKH